jgi:signal transduction histidine kinase
LASILTLGIAAVIALVISAITWLDVRRERSSTHDSLAQRAVLLADTLSPMVADRLYFSDVDALRDVAASLRDRPDLAYFLIFRPDGRLLVSNLSSRYPVGRVPEPVREEALQDMETSLRFHGDDLDVAMPIEAGHDIIGVVQFGFRSSTLDARIRDIIVQHVWQGLVLMAIGMALAYLIARYAARPIARLAAAARQIGEGKLSYSVPIGGTRETLELAMALDSMRKELQSLYTGLEQQVAQRTAELDRTNDALQRQMAERERIAEQRARLLEEVSASQERLRALSSRLVEVQEAERRHLARELHDEIGQLLTGLKLTLEARGRSSAKAESGDLDTAQALVDSLIEQVRNLSLNLRPAMLDDLGLVPALVWYFDRYTAQTGVKVLFSHDGNGRARPDVETAAYRIIQEALTNVARHAEVREAVVTLSPHVGNLELRVQDDGAGFDPHVFAAATSTGLNGMRERAELLGGRLTVDSAPGAGTTVTALLPLEDRVPREQP